MPSTATHQPQHGQGRKRKEEEQPAPREGRSMAPPLKSPKTSNANAKAPSPVSSKPLPPPTTPDAAFPRGGQAVHRRPGSDKSGKRGEAAAMEVDADALDFVKPAAAASRRMSSSAPSSSSSSSAFVPPLRRSHLVPGARLLGVVTSVTSQKVEVALPTGLRGSSASRMAAAALPTPHSSSKSMSTNKSASPPLSALYRVGQVVRCAVVGKKEKMSALEGHDGDTSSDDDENEGGGEGDDESDDGAAAARKSNSTSSSSKKKKRAVLLTMSPAAVAGPLPRSALFSGNPVTGWIASEEDHGFVVDLGSPGVIGFLPRADAPKLDPSSLSSSASSTLPPSFARGAQLDLVVASDGPSAGTNVVQLKAAPQAGAGPPSKEPPASDAAALRCLPLGALVSATVSASSPENPGAGVHLKFWTYLTGAADAFALPTLAEEKSFGTRFAVGTKHRARVVFVDSGSAKIVRLSLLPHVVSRSLPSPVLPAVGTLIENGTVKRVDEGLGVLVEFPNYQNPQKSVAAAATPPPSAPSGGHPATQSLLGYAHVSNASDGRVASLAKLFKVGDVVAAARVVGSRPTDALAALSLAPAATAAGTLGSAAELRVGETVKGVVEAAHPSRGLLISLAPGVRARVPIEQLVAGEPGGASAVAAVARRPAGSKVSARVFSVSSSNKGEGGGPDSSTRATLTLRKALVSPGGDASAAPKLAPILSIAEAKKKPGLKTHGVVTGPAPGGWHRGVFVSLYGGLTGVVAGGAELGLGPRVTATLAAAASASASGSGSSRSPGAASTPAAAAATAAAAAEVASALPRGTLVKARVLSADPATGKVRLSLAGGGGEGGEEEGGADAATATAAASAATAAEDAAAAAALTERLSGGYAAGDVLSADAIIRIVAVERDDNGKKKKKEGEEEDKDSDDDDDDDDDDESPPSAFIVELPSLPGKKKNKKKGQAAAGPLARILRCHLSDSPRAAAALASSLTVGGSLPPGTGVMVLDVRAVGRAAAAAALAAEKSGSEKSSSSSSSAKLLLLPITVSLTRKASMVRAAPTLPRSNEPEALAALAEGVAVRGFVASLTPNSVFVRFLGRATGRAPLPRGGKSSTSTSLSVGDSVSAVVSAVDAAAGRFSLSLGGKRKTNGAGESEREGAARALGDLFADLATAAAARAENDKDDDEESPSSSSWPSPGAVVEAHPSEAKPYGLLLDLEAFPDAAALAPAPRHHFDGILSAAPAAKSGKKSKDASSSSLSVPEPSMPAARTLRARVLDVAAADGVVDVSLRSELLLAEEDENETSSSLPPVGSSVSAVVELSRPDYLVLSIAAASSSNKKSKKASSGRLIGFAPVPAVPLELGSAVEGVEVAELPSAAANGGRLILSLPASLTAAIDGEDEAEDDEAEEKTRKGPPKARQTPAERAAARAALRAAEAALAAEAVQPGTLVSAVVVSVHPLHAEVRLSGSGGEGSPYAGRQGRVHATEARDDDDDDDESERSKKRAKKTSSSSPKALPLPFAGLSPGDEIKAVVLGAAATPGGRAHGVLELSTRASLVAAAEKEEKEEKDKEVKAAAAADDGEQNQNQSQSPPHHLPRASLRPRVVVSSLTPGSRVRGFVQDVRPDGAWIALSPTARARLRALDAAADLEALAAFADSSISTATSSSSSTSPSSLSAGSPVDATVLRVVRRADGGGIDVDLTTLPVSKAAAREAAAGDLVLGLVKSLPLAASSSSNNKSSPASALGDGCVRVSFSPSPHAPVSVGRVSLCDLRDEWSADALAGIRVGTAVRCRVLEAAAAGGSGGSGKKEARLSLRASDGGAISSSSSSSPAQPLLPSLRLPKPLPADAQPSSLKVGDRVAGYVAAVGRPGAFVALSRSLDGRVPLRDLAAGFVPEPAAAFPPGTLVVGRVAALVPGGKVQLTLRAGVVPGGSEGEGEGKDEEAPLGAVAALLQGGAEGAGKASSRSAVRVGAVVAGRVRRAEAFGVFVDLDSANPSVSFSSLPPLRAGLAHVSELADEFVADPGAMFRPGQRVTARVLKVDAATGRVSLSLRPSAVKGEPRPLIAGRDDDEGMMVGGEEDGEEEEEESDIDDHAEEQEEEEEEAAGMELDDESDGDGSEEENSDSPSAGLDSDDDDLGALRLSAGGISRDNSAEVSDEDDEEEEDESSDDDEESASDEGDGDGELDLDDDLGASDSDSDSDVDARLGAAAAGGGRSARSPAPSRKSAPSSSSAAAGLGGLDVGLPVGWGEDDDGENGKANAATTPAPTTPSTAAASASASLSKAAKRRAERAAAAASEAATDAAEAAVASRAAPADEASFRRALAASPNSSFLWIRYVAHLLSLGEADRARAALAAALDSIALEATADRFNVWVAALNLEATHGSSASSSSSSGSSATAPDRAAATMALFRRAARHTDAKKLHLALVPILERAGLAGGSTGAVAAAAAAAAAATKAFPTSCKVWLARHAAALRAGDAPAAALALRSATVGGHDGKGALPPRKHVKFLSRAAVAEFKNSNNSNSGGGEGQNGGSSSAERGRELFEKLLAAAPKRLDLWAQYIDQEVALALAGTGKASGKRKRRDGAEEEKMKAAADPRRVRALFARGTALDLPPKKMKFLFRRALEFEKRLGDDAGADRVREAARAYVAKVSGSG